jgi:hypothetical protein
MVRVVAGPAPALARDLLAATEPTATRYRLAAMTANAVLAEAVGDPETAAAGYAQAAAGWTAYTHALERALALLGRGRCLTAMGDPEAADVLRVAAGLLARLGARPAVAEAAALLQPTG